MGKSSSRAPAPPDPYRTASADAAINRTDTYTPVGSSTFGQGGIDPATGMPTYRQDIRMSPEQQQLYNLQYGGQRELGAAGMRSAAGINSSGMYDQPMNTSGLPALTSNAYGNMPGLQTGVNAQGLPELGDSEKYRTSALDALYGLNTRYLDPQFERGEDRLRTRLANQGAVEGSEAWDNAMTDFNQNKETAYRQARDSSIAGSGNEASRLFGIDSASRGQQYGERLTGADFTNQARGQAFGENVTNADLSNAARGQGLGELLALRQQPLSEYGQLSGYSQPQMPTASGPTPVDLSGNVYRSYQGDLDIYNANQSGRNNLLSSLFNLGGTLGGAAILSDENAKENISPVGEIGDLGIYTYNYVGDDKPQVGVLAQEAELVDPSSVSKGRDGLKRVNYQKAIGSALMRAA